MALFKTEIAIMPRKLDIYWNIFDLIMTSVKTLLRCYLFVDIVEKRSTISVLNLDKNDY